MRWGPIGGVGPDPEWRASVRPSGRAGGLKKVAQSVYIYVSWKGEKTLQLFTYRVYIYVFVEGEFHVTTVAYLFHQNVYIYAKWILHFDKNPFF